MLAWKVILDAPQNENELQATQAEDLLEPMTVIQVMMKMKHPMLKYPLPYSKAFQENNLMHIFWQLKTVWKLCYSR